MNHRICINIRKIGVQNITTNFSIYYAYLLNMMIKKLIYNVPTNKPAVYGEPFNRDTTRLVNGYYPRIHTLNPEVMRGTSILN